MSRWITVLLAAGLSCALTLTIPTVALHAQDDIWATEEPATTTTEPPATEEPATEEPTTEEPATTVTPEAPVTATTPVPDDANKTLFVSKAQIRALVTEGKLAEAEKAYLDWAAYWKQDDATLVVSVERALLYEAYKGGDFTALVDLVQAGDLEALQLIRAQVLAGGEEADALNLATGIRILSDHADRSTLNTLQLSLYHENPLVVNAAIEALGKLGDARVAPELMKLFDNADDERSVLLARTLARLGAAKKVYAQFAPQLNFPMPGMRERAALVLAASGYADGWETLRQCIDARKEPYYPLALTVLGSLPSEESAALVAMALAGEEPEQLAALQSIGILPADKQQQISLVLFRDPNAPMKVRQASLELLKAKNIAALEKDVRTLAFATDDKDISALTPSAMKSLPKFGLLNAHEQRDFVRYRISQTDPGLSRAARVALLSWAMQTKAGEAAPKDKNKRK